MARRRSFFVPRSVLGASFGGVVPACVAIGIQACSSPPVYGVAAVAYCCFEAGLPDGDGGDATEASTDADTDATADAPDDGSNDGADE
jgi:hypothetical protein